MWKLPIIEASALFICIMHYVYLLSVYIPEIHARAHTHKQADTHKVIKWID